MRLFVAFAVANLCGVIGDKAMGRYRSSAAGAAAWAAGLAASCLLLLGVTDAQAQQKNRVVNVYNWSDYIDESVLKEFEAETGIKVRYDVFDSNETLETKLLTGRTGYDVVVPSGSFLQRQIKAGVFQKLDFAKLPNRTNLWPEVMDRLAVYDPGNLHAVNYMWGTTGIGYNVDKARERVGDRPMNTWDVIMNPEIIGKFKDCGIHILDAPEELIPSTLSYLGLNPDSKNEADLNKAYEAIAKIRPFVRKFHSSEYINALANGDICLVVGWSGDVFQAKKRAEEAAEKTKRTPVRINYVIPKEGALMWFDNMAIPKDAKNVEEAHAFINFMMRPDIAARNANAVSYGTGNQAALDKIDESIRKNPSVYPDDDTMKKLFTVTAYDQKTQRQVTRLWTRFKTGR